LFLDGGRNGGDVASFLLDGGSNDDVASLLLDDGSNDAVASLPLDGGSDDDDDASTPFITSPISKLLAEIENIIIILIYINANSINNIRPIT